MAGRHRIGLRPHAGTLLGMGLALVAGLFAAGAAAAPADVKPEELLARSITRLALMDLRATTAPTIEDYRAASTLLTIAHEVAPEDDSILRRAIEAAYAAEDQGKVIELTRALLLLPSEEGDTVAQLRLITASIARNAQDADSRLRAYGNYIDGQGKTQFSDAVRSRLALDAAMLLRDLGDTRGFVERLTQAVKLDSTHKEAAALAATYYGERVPEDRVGGMEWLVVLLMADPLDPNVHLAMARELASAGAYESARRFQANAVNIMAAAGGAGDQVALQSLVLRWYLEGPAAVHEAINHDLLVQRDAVTREARRREESGQPTDGVPKPDDLRLTPPVAALAVLAARANGDDAAALRVLEDLLRTVELTFTQLQEASRRGEIGEDDARRRGAELALQIQSLRLWSGLQLAEVAADLEKVGALAEAFPEAFTLLNGWLKVRSGDAAGGIAMLEPIADANAMARLGLAYGYEQAGRAEDATREYLRVLRDHPLEGTGAWARTRLDAMGAPVESATRAALERIAAGVPAWVDGMVLNPGRYVQMTVEVDDRGPEAIQRIPVRITLQNLSPVPLAIGADRTLSSRLLLAPKLEAALAGGGLDQPEVIDINRRLRLKPREKLTVTVWPDPGESGWLMEAMANRSFRVRWRVVQGFRFDPAGGYRPGPMGLTAETDAIIRRPLPEATVSLADLAAMVRSEPTATLPRLAIVMRAHLLQAALVDAARAARGDGGGDAAPRAEAFTAIAEAFAARYPSLPAVQRGILVAVLPHAGLDASMAPFDRVLRAEADPMVQALVIATRASTPEDDLLKAASQSPDERLRGLAADVAARLRTDQRLYSRLTPASFLPAAGGQAAGAAR